MTESRSSRRLSRSAFTSCAELAPLLPLLPLLHPACTASPLLHRLGVLHRRIACAASSVLHRLYFGRRPTLTRAPGPRRPWMLLRRGGYGRCRGGCDRSVSYAMRPSPRRVRTHRIVSCAMRPRISHQAWVWGFRESPGDGFRIDSPRQQDGFRIRDINRRQLSTSGVRHANKIGVACAGMDSGSEISTVGSFRQSPRRRPRKLPSVHFRAEFVMQLDAGD